MGHSLWGYFVWFFFFKEKGHLFQEVDLFLWHQGMLSRMDGFHWQMFHSLWRHGQWSISSCLTRFTGSNFCPWSIGAARICCDTVKDRPIFHYQFFLSLALYMRPNLEEFSLFNLSVNQNLFLKLPIVSLSYICQKRFLIFVVNVLTRYMNIYQIYSYGSGLLHICFAGENSSDMGKLFNIQWFMQIFLESPLQPFLFSAYLDGDQSLGLNLVSLEEDLQTIELLCQQYRRFILNNRPPWPRKVTTRSVQNCYVYMKLQ